MIKTLDIAYRFGHFETLEEIAATVDVGEERPNQIRFVGYPDVVLSRFRTTERLYGGRSTVFRTVIAR